MTTVDTSCEAAMKWLWDFSAMERKVLNLQDVARDVIEVVNDRSMFVYRSIGMPRPFKGR